MSADHAADVAGLASRGSTCMGPSKGRAARKSPEGTVTGHGALKFKLAAAT
jgi:hypothetical protein